MTRFVNSETDMAVACVLEVVDENVRLRIRVRWRVLPNSEDTLEPQESVYEDAPQMLLRLLDLKKTPCSSIEQAHGFLGL